MFFLAFYTYLGVFTLYLGIKMTKKNQKGIYRKKYKILLILEKVDKVRAVGGKTPIHNKWIICGFFVEPFPYYFLNNHPPIVICKGIYFFLHIP